MDGLCREALALEAINQELLEACEALVAMVSSAQRAAAQKAGVAAIAKAKGESR